jgi:hypothetical protein
MSRELVRKVTGTSDTHYRLEIEGKQDTTGGWVHKCGHFAPSSFIQVVYSDDDCTVCCTAKAILAEAKDFRDKGVAGISRWK